MQPLFEKEFDTFEEAIKYCEKLIQDKDISSYKVELTVFNTVMAYMFK